MCVRLMLAASGANILQGDRVPTNLRDHAEETGKGDPSGSWQVSGRVYNRFNDPPFLGKGWTSFCRDNDLKEGDVCTFKITEPTLWRVDIARSSS
jgi:hypothetical protein